MSVVFLPPSNLYQPCFPDVPTDIWFAEPVCKAKKLGIVQGNALPGVPSSEWLFEPSRNVQYEEAVKVLLITFGIPPSSIGFGEWYEKYLRTAEELDLHLAELFPGNSITRGEMARLVAGFVAYRDGELEELRAAERGETLSSSSSVSLLSTSSQPLVSSASLVSSSKEIAVISSPIPSTNLWFLQSSAVYFILIL